MAQDPIRMVADKQLTKNISSVASFDDLKALLHGSIENSPKLGLERDLQSGQFVPRRDPLEPAAQKVDDSSRVFSRDVEIGGKTFSFSDSTPEGLESQITSAQIVAANLQDAKPATSRETRYKSSVTRAEELLAQDERKIVLEANLRAGLITPQDFLAQSGAIDSYLASRGVNVEKIAGEQLQQSWSEATEKFMHSPAGRDWPGGHRNLELIGMQIATLGLVDADDKVAALAQAYESIKKRGLLFNDTSDEQMLKETENLSPQEILERFKAAHGGDPEQANSGFIAAHRGGRIGGSSGIFGV